MIFLKYYKIFLFCTLIKVNEKLINYIAYLLNLLGGSIRFSSKNLILNLISNHTWNHQ